MYNADVALLAQKAIARNQVDTDRATLEKMHVAYDQAVRQLKLGAVTGYNENSVQYAVAAAQRAAITNHANQQQLAFTQITAPFSGLVQSIATQSGDPLTPLHSGDAVTAGQMLFTIAQSGSDIVKAQVDEQDIINVHPGQGVIVSGQDFPGKHIAGHVALVAPVAIKSTDASSTARQILTTIRLESSPAYLKDGMTVDVDILTANVRNVLLVPNEAIVTDKGRKYVFAIRGGKAHKTSIVAGQANDTQTIVTAGLSAGEVIVAQKTPALKDGMRVTAAASPSPLPAS